MDKLKTIYIAGLLLIGVLLVFISFQTGYHAATPTPEIKNWFIETEEEKIVGFRIYNDREMNQNYTFAILLNGEEIGRNPVFLGANQTFEFLQRFPNEKENTEVTMLIWRGEEVIHNKTCRL